MTAKGKRERGRQGGRRKQVSFRSSFSFSFSLGGRKGESASRRSYTEDICHSSPLFFLFSFAFVFPSLLWPQLVFFSSPLHSSPPPERSLMHQQASLFEVFCLLRPIVLHLLCSVPAQLSYSVTSLFSPLLPAKLLLTSNPFVSRA